MHETMADSAVAIIAEISGGEGLSLSGAASVVPGTRPGGHTAPSTIYRWIFTGAKDRVNGGRIRLEAARVGGRLMTSRPAIERFIARLTGSMPAVVPAEIRSPRKRRQAVERANSELTSRGA